MHEISHDLEVLVCLIYFCSVEGATNVVEIHVLYECSKRGKIKNILMLCVK